MRELASLICKSSEAVETFITHCEVAACDLLMPYGDVLIAEDQAHLMPRASMRSSQPVRRVKRWHSSIGGVLIGVHASCRRNHFRTNFSVLGHIKAMIG